MSESVGARLVALVMALGVALGLLWLGAWLLDVVLGPFTPLLTATVVATLVLFVLGRDGE